MEMLFAMFLLFLFLIGSRAIHLDNEENFAMTQLRIVLDGEGFHIQRKIKKFFGGEKWVYCMSADSDLGPATYYTEEAALNDIRRVFGSPKIIKELNI